MKIPDPNRVRLAHFSECNGKRVVTIAYRYISIESSSYAQILYGAAQFRKIQKHEVWDRKAHNSTAISRLKKYPVTVFVPFELPLKKAEKLLRKYVIRFGVKAMKDGNFEACGTIYGSNGYEAFCRLLDIHKNKTLQTFYKPSKTSFHYRLN